MDAFHSNTTMNSSDNEILSQAATQIEEAMEKPDRFALPVSDKEVADLAEINIPKNTRKVMNWAVKSFDQWRKNRISL